MKLQSEPGFTRRQHWAEAENQARKFLTTLLHGPMLRPIDAVFLVRLGAGVVLVAAGLRLCFLDSAALPIIGFALVTLGALLVVETLRFDNSRD
jgi:hypothetical protein